jgi:hypothetical protein
MTDEQDEPHQLGDYLLEKRVAEDALSITWLAKQLSISRNVLLGELRESQLGHQSQFLADVRAKAAVDHPLISSVYEAVADPGRCFYTYELLPGMSLAEMIGKSPSVTPQRMTRIIHRICEANLYYESHDRASSPLTLDDIFINEHDVVRLRNLAVSGTRDSGQNTRDIIHLGKTLEPLVATGRPGSTRILTLLRWMRGEEVQAPLQWLEIINLCEQIDQQLAGPVPPPSPLPENIPRVSKRPIVLLAAITGVALLVVLLLAVKMRPAPVEKPDIAKLPPPVSIDAGPHPTADGTAVELAKFRISAHEITIGEYQKFLETLDLLAAEDRQRTFDHPEQPSEKTSHLPDDWAALFAAAKIGDAWRGMPVTLASPVTGVDWWDAVAYAEWKQGRLPTSEEWSAALIKGANNPQAIPASAWVPVSTDSPDRNSIGMFAMAGSLAEWTNTQSANPSNPLGPKFWVITGGSYAKPGTGALSREWVEDRSLRRPDLGFRVVWDD